jgi:hypothetical protein
MSPGSTCPRSASTSAFTAWGNVWPIATHIEDVDPAEMQRRAQAAAR